MEDEAAQQLLKDVYGLIEMKPLQDKQEDNRYECKGTQSIFMFVDPNGGW